MSLVCVSILNSSSEDTPGLVPGSLSLETDMTTLYVLTSSLALLGIVAILWNH
mgnify:CR=1 FL=1